VRPFVSVVENHLLTVVDPLANVLLRHVVPLFNIPPGKRPACVGTGFFVSVGATSYLVSAAHVFDYITKPGSLHYYVNANILRNVSGRLLSSKIPPGGVRKDDRFDVGVIRLVGPRLPPYREIEKVSLSLSALRSFGPLRGQKQYLAIGFPESRSRPNPRDRELNSKASAFSAMSAELGMYSRLGVSPKSHIVLSVDVERMVAPNGSVQAIPDPHGMSGSPLFLLYDDAGPNDPQVTPVTGVIIEHHRKTKAIVATDISYVIDLIRRAI